MREAPKTKAKVFCLFFFKGGGEGGRGEGGKGGREKSLGLIFNGNGGRS